MIENSIDALIRKLERKNLLNPKVSLYSESIKAKFSQVRWSIEVLREIEHKPSVESSASSINAWTKIGINDKIVFFCECFWDFLRSSIDVTAQLVNELKSLSINEDDVSFYEVRNRMIATMFTTPLFKSIKSMESSWAFKDLNSYRHCSTHRRQVYIGELPSQPSPLTRVYEYLDTSTTRPMNRYLCKNPSSLKPRMSLKRPVVEYNERMLKEIERRLTTIVNRLV